MMEERSLVRASEDSQMRNVMDEWGDGERGVGQREGDGVRGREGMGASTGEFDL